MGEEAIRGNNILPPTSHFAPASRAAAVSPHPAISGFPFPSAPAYASFLDPSLLRPFASHPPSSRERLEKRGGENII